MSKILIDKATMKLALEAIESDGWCDTEPVITAIQEALAQPEREPTKIAALVDALIQKYSDKLYESVGPHDAAKFEEDCNHIKQTLTEQPAQQEPVAWMTQARNFVDLSEFTEAQAKLYGWKAVCITPQPAQPGREALEAAHTRLQKRYGELEAKQLAQKEPVAFCDPSDPNARTAFSWPGFDRQPHHTATLHTTPPQRKPQFKEFIEWAGAQGYDCAHTCNSDTGEWIALNPMTADLWKAWQAAHGITKGSA